MCSMLLVILTGAHGKVVDERGNVIPEAKVKLDHHVNSHPTSNTGEFFFIMTEGKHVIEVSAKGKNSLSYIVSIQCLEIVKVSPRTAQPKIL